MTASQPLWVTILVGLGFPTLLIAAAGAVWRYVTSRAAKKARQLESRSDREEDRSDRREDREQTWNDRVRGNIERHIPWDAMARADLMQLRVLVNDLRVGQGKAPVEFEPLPDAPPLFPPPDLPGAPEPRGP